MQTHTLNLVTANFWKQNQFRYRNKMDGRTQIFVSDCGVRLPHWVVITKGLKGLEIGWNHRNQFFGQERPAASTHSIGRQTRADIESGFSSGLCTAWAKEAWSRHEQGAPCEHEDNHKEHVSCAPYEEVRWGGCWNGHRSRNGWTPFAFLSYAWKGVTWAVQTRKEFDGWAIGCPCWYSEHKP